MTLRECLHDYLTERGLWPKEADEVINIYQDKENSMAHRWGDKQEDYPPQLLTVLFVAVRHETVLWIDKNKPKHFARAMFA